MTQAWMRHILERYGQTAELEREAGRTTIRAFLQPQMERGESAVEAWSSLGALDGRTWLYLGDAEVRTGDLLHWEGRTFRVRSGRAYCLGDRAVCWQASLERAKEGAQ